MRARFLTAKQLIFRYDNLVFLFTTFAFILPWSSTPAEAKFQPDPSDAPVTDIGGSNVERAYALLQNEGKQFTLIIVLPNSAGLEGEIYHDLRLRGFRATAGPVKALTPGASLAIRVACMCESKM